MLDLEPAAQEVIRLVGGITDDQLTAPTPSTDTSVADLLDHLTGLALAFTWAARKSAEDVPGASAPPPPASADNLDPQWRTLLPARLDELVEAWRKPDAWTGMTMAGGVTQPAEVMGMVALDELVLHGWDLAKATGQQFHCDPASTEAVLAFTTESARPEQAAGREGLFGPVVPVPADAPPFDRALGFAGRDPNWTPA
ncbi:TIGR03086 family metal-binding protein [Plantactinospora endophytica]|uniref:TIGR03086 family protein n=1 Tax=Plantactinospora endophytica TaxID=673535 RepID=A0ABQ4DTS5_9ACTN|nr:TIGR03086 family metal-binding protein [Plantactinospora endophytica]GIG85819.1 TIGR03086 family protein [Plantactinospora endophytica]